MVWRCIQQAAHLGVLQEQRQAVIGTATVDVLAAIVSPTTAHVIVTTAVTANVVVTVLYGFAIRTELAAVAE